MIHIALHFLVPLLTALLFYRSSWRSAAFVMMGTMIVDVDHVLAAPIYDPLRCSIDFHPLHTTPAIVIYAAIFALTLVLRRGSHKGDLSPKMRILHLITVGLLIHMALDWIDCVI